MLLNALAALGHRGIKTIATFGRAGLMLFNAVVGKPEFRKHAPLLVRQLYNVGVLSMLIIIVSGLFIGMVLGLQGYLVLTTYSAETSLGMLVALSLLRELGPVVAALLFAGRAGSALTAEIGLMRATEQLSSMEMMAVDPLRRVISPRFWAGVISLPLLTIIFVAVGVWGGSLVGVNWKGIDAGFFWTAMQNAVDWRMDLVNCLIKSLVFAITVTWIALFNGYDAIPTSAGISRATTRTVVHASLAVLGLDFVLTALVFLLVALLAALFVCLKAANVTSIRTEPTYRLYATFDNIGGLKARSPVRIGGVVVGRVADITLDPKTYLPRVALDIDERYNHIPDTSSLAIRTSGLLGEQYLAMNIGFEDPELGTAILKDGGTIQDTKSAMVLEDLIGQFLYNSKGSDNKNSGDEQAAGESHTDATPPAGTTH